VLLTPPLFRPNFGGVLVAPDRHVGVSPHRGPKLFGREIIFQEFQPMRSRYLKTYKLKHNILHSRTGSGRKLQHCATHNFCNNIIVFQTAFMDYWTVYHISNFTHRSVFHFLYLSIFCLVPRARLRWLLATN